jgi:hypothetical protein
VKFISGRVAKQKAVNVKNNTPKKHSLRVRDMVIFPPVKFFVEKVFLNSEDYPAPTSKIIPSYIDKTPINVVLYGGQKNFLTEVFILNCYKSF